MMIIAETMLQARYRMLSERDRILLDRAIQTLKDNILQPEAGQILPWSPYRGIIPSPGTYRGIWNWDAAFHAVGTAYWDTELAREQVRILLDAQLPGGALPDVIFEDGRIVKTFGKPPVMPWAAAWIDRADPNDAFLAYAYPRFTAYEAHWRAHRCVGGLFHYDSAEDTLEKQEEHARLESGWDNSVRWDRGARCLWPVDLNSYMVMLYRALATFAARLGIPEDQRRYEACAIGLVDLINERLFDEASGAYLDRSYESGEFSPVFSPASFVPLYARIVPVERAQRMADLAGDPRKFFPGMPTVSYDDPAYESGSYWRGPTWLNTAYFAAKGLCNYGFAETAWAIRETVLGWCAQNEDALYEYYDSHTGQGLGARQFGWSAAFVMCFLLDW